MPVPIGCSVTVLTVHAQVMIGSAADRRSWTPLHSALRVSRFQRESKSSGR